MKKLIIGIIVGLLVGGAGAFAVSYFLGGSSSPSVTSSYVNDDSHVIIVYSDGKEEDLGKVEGEKTTEKITITDTKVDENGHLVITYSNGETEDFGDVTVLPPQYSVKFLDKDGNVIKTETVYKGTDATAPSAPSVADMTFDKWDADFTNVQGDIEVRATYKDMDAFTVTFVNTDGTVLKTEKVIVGRGATAPNSPTKDGYVFEGWDIDFTNIQSDITVTAVFRVKGSSTVTFVDYSGLALGSVSVKEGGTATAPVTPTRDGYTFNGWSSSLSGITSNKTVTAKYKLKSGTNILDISYSLGKNNTVTVTVTMKGNVKFASLEGEMTVPSGLTFKSVTAGDDKSLANYDKGTIYFSTTNTSNITKETVIFKATFTYGTANSYTLNTVIKDICDQGFAPVSSSVIGKTVKVK